MTARLSRSSTLRIVLTLVLSVRFVSAQEPSASATQTTQASVKSNVTPPKLIHHVDPQYSLEARQKGINGEVLVGLFIDEKGEPQDVHVIRGIGYGLDEEAVKAVGQYRFIPAARDGKPVKVQLTIAVRFAISFR
jgi:TonB family protein